MQIFTRPANTADIETLQSLKSEALATLDQFRGGNRYASQINLYDQSWLVELADSAVKIFVSGVDDVVMGYLLVRRHGQRATAVATIEQVFVTQDTRNLGLGDSLVAATIAWAKSEKLDALDGFALPGDRETKNLFERSGLVARLITVSSDLKG